MAAIETVQLSDDIGDNISDAIETIVDFSADIVNDAVVTETRCDAFKARVAELEAELETARANYGDVHQEYILSQRRLQETEEAVVASLSICHDRETELKTTIALLESTVHDHHKLAATRLLDIQRLEAENIKIINISNAKMQQAQEHIDDAEAEARHLETEVEQLTHSLRALPGSRLNPIIVDSASSPLPISPLMFHTPVDSEWDDYEDDDIKAL